MARIFELIGSNSLAGNIAGERLASDRIDTLWNPSAGRFFGVDRAGEAFKMLTVGDIVNLSLLKPKFVGGKEMIITILGLTYGENIVNRFQENRIFGKEIFNKIADLQSAIFTKVKFDEGKRGSFARYWDEKIGEAAILEEFYNIFIADDLIEVWDAIAATTKAGVNWADLREMPFPVWYYSATALGFVAPKFSATKVA